MLCSVILQNVNFILDDPNNTFFSLSQKIAAINSALQALVSYRPDAASLTAMMLLVAGTRQTLPSDGVRLLKVIRNRGVSGLSDAGRAIRKADMLVQDALIPDWHTTTGQTTIDEYFYDSITPKDFYVYPPAPVSPIIGIDISYVRVLPTITAGTDIFPVDEYFYDSITPKDFYVYPPAPVSPVIGVDISYVRVLPTITAGTDTLPVDDYFAPAIQEWMLYSIMGSDDEQNPNYAVARSHQSTFFQLLQIKAASDGAVNPKSKG